jgi:hypothetical protein
MVDDSSGEFEYEPVPSRRTVVFVAILSIVAIVLAGASIAINLLRPASAASTESCRALSWASLPDPSTLPAGWTLAGSGFYSDGFSTSFVGPASADSTTASPSIYVRLNCLGSDDHLALTRSHDAAVAAGASSLSFAKLGDESFALQDSTGGTTVYFRRSGIVVYLVAASTVTPTELQQSATAVDLAIAAATASGGSGIEPTPGLPSGGVGARSPVPSAIGSVGPGASPSSPPSHDVPDLEAILPHKINGTTFTSESLTGANALGTDPASAALTTSIKGFGKTVADFQVAEVYDPSGTVGVTVIGFRVVGVDPAKVRQAIIASWMVAAGTGLTTSPATVAGKAVIKVDYGDGGPLDYVYVHGTTVLDVSTADPALAATVLGLLP